MEKILSFIVNENKELLLLKGSPNDPQFRKSLWYVVTGGCEAIDKSKEDTVKREIKEDLVYKIKKFNNKGEILEQTSIRLKILDCEDAEKFMTAIGYKRIMNIIEEDYEYTKDNFYLTTKDIKGGDKLIEAETQIDDSNYDTIDKIKKKLIEENIPLDFSDCFIKKAEIELDKVLERK